MFDTFLVDLFGGVTWLVSQETLALRNTRTRGVFYVGVRPEYSCRPWKVIMMESLNDWEFDDLTQFG